jgi:hypothetical protein
MGNNIMVVHIVLFNFQDENKVQNLLSIKVLLEALPSKIKELKSLEVGINFDTTDRAMDLSLHTTFETKDDLNTYATHEEHVKVVDEIKKIATLSKVVDYIK